MVIAIHRENIVIQIFDKINLQQSAIIYISPHLDDAILGAGATLSAIAQLGSKITVLTVFAGEPIGISNDVQMRRQEDILACQELGVVSKHLDFLDAIYRKDGRGKNIYPTLSSVIEAPADEDELVREIGRILAPSIEKEKIIAPAGRSRHVDHQILRKVCDEYLSPFAYYDDYPYFAGSATKLVSFIPKLPRQAIKIQVNKQSLMFKAKAVDRYMSQLEFLFGSNANVHSAIMEYSNVVGGELHWVFRSQKDNLYE
jgi:LmbE family N-acetylglucosaminyl deacetylase